MNRREFRKELYRRGPDGRFMEKPSSVAPTAELEVELDPRKGIGGRTVAMPELEKEVGSLPDLFDHFGASLYLVGGAVRDRVLGEELTNSSDLDMTTDAEPETIHQALEGWADSIWDQGEKFGTVAAIRGGRSIEITTHRADSYDPASRKPQVQFSDSLEDDLARRDFTINALAVDLSDWSLIDPFGGIQDLEQRRLRTPLDPEVTFSDDPLRMLRAARFVARFDMAPDPKMTKAMASQADRLSIVSVERIEQEIDKLLELPDPKAGLDLLRETGLAKRILPNLTKSDMDSAAAVPANHGVAVRLAVLLSSNTAVDGAEDALGKWNMSNAKSQEILGALAAGWSAQEVAPDNLPELRRWLVESKNHADNGIAVAQAITKDKARIGRLAKALDLLRQAEPDLGSDILSGREIMELLNVESGPVVGRAKRHLAELRIEQGPITQEAARAHLNEWAAAIKL